MTTQPLRSWLLFTVTTFGILGWVMGTIGANLVVGLLAPLGALAATVWKRCGSAERRAEAELVAEALRNHRDPGADDRETVDQQARAVLASPPWAPWISLVLGALLAAACVVMAVVDPSTTAWFAAGAAFLGGGLLTRAGLTDVRAAELWLDDPPYAAEPTS